ncbi:MAG: hypothetical protein FRX49_00790 [Trebouxia sp. A1-2]|nr:MAG: hypothetical protein FRX49_00790 [Trebouxia sp. A1-2]
MTRPPQTDSLIAGSLWECQYLEQDSTSEDAVTALHLAAFATGQVYLRPNKSYLPAVAAMKTS